MTVTNGELTATAIRRRSIGWRVAVGLIGAALYAFANWSTFAIAVPGTEDVSIRPQFALVTFFGFAFGPVVGLLTGFVGNVLGDWLGGLGALSAWPWSVANGAVGLLAGIGAVALGPQLSGANSRALMAGVVSVTATVLGFLFIWIELVTQPELGFQYILTREYLPTVVVNSVIAAIVTPVLVLAWEPLREHLS